MAAGKAYWPTVNCRRSVIEIIQQRTSHRSFTPQPVESVPVESLAGGKPWYAWDPPSVEHGAKTGKIARLVETGSRWCKPPEVKTSHHQAYLRFSADGGRSGSPSLKVPQWERQPAK